MKPIALSLASAVIAFVSFAAAAAPASAGLEFTDLASLQSASPSVTFNGSSVAGTTQVMSNGFGPNSVTLASTGAFAAPVATVDFAYTGAFGGVKSATYAFNVGSPSYFAVIQFGTITGTVVLQSITFVEAPGGVAVPTPYTLSRVLTAADSNLRFFIPAPGGAPIASERDNVQAVRLNFSFASGSASSVVIQAVTNPEPGTIALFGLGLVGLAGAVRSRRRKSLAKSV